MGKIDRIARQYEDVLFALMMQDVVEHEGAQILRQVKELELDPAAAVPELVNTRMEQSIRSFFARKKAKRYSRQMRSAVRKLAVAALVSSFLLTSAFAYSEEFRVGTLNLMIDVFDQGTQITFRSSQPQQQIDPRDREQNVRFDLSVGWLPEGYVLDTGWSDTQGSCMRYINKFGADLDITVDAYSETLTLIFDTEDCTQKNIQIQGNVATLYAKSEEAMRRRYPDDPEFTSDLTVMWCDYDAQAVVLVHAMNLTEEEIIKLAETVRY